MMPFPEKFRLGLGIIWSLAAICFLISLLPGVWKRQRAWEARLKGSGVNVHSPSWPQRLVALLLIGLMSADLVVTGLHHDFYKLTGISSATVCDLMLLLPAIYFVLPWLERRLRKSQ